MDIRVEYLREMSLVAEAVSRVFGADKMNYELLGNADSHLHWHLFPRRAKDMELPGPVWMLPKEIMFAKEYRIDGEQLEERIHKLSEELDVLLHTSL